METFIRCIEACDEEDIFGNVHSTLQSITTKKNCGQILAGGNWERLFKLLPEQLTEEPISQKTQHLFMTYAHFSSCIKEQFDCSNALVMRILTYLHNPISKIAVNVTYVCQCLEQCIRYHHGNNPFQLDHLSIAERLLELLKSVPHDEESFQAALCAFEACVIDQPDFKYFKVSRALLDECIVVIESRRMKCESYLLVVCLNIASHYEELLELFFESEYVAKRLCHHIGKEEEGLTLFMQVCKEHPTLGVKWFMKYKFMKVVVSMLKGISQSEEGTSLLSPLKKLLLEAEKLVDGETLYNPIALQVEEMGGVKILKRLERNHKKAKSINATYFGEKWENYLARRRGLKTKKAV